MIDPKIIEAAARDSYFADRTDVADESHVKNYCSGFKAGYAQAAEDMVPMEVVESLREENEKLRDALNYADHDRNCTIFTTLHCSCGFYKLIQKLMINQKGE